MTGWTAEFRGLTRATRAPFETGPAKNPETLRLVEHAYWAAGLRYPRPDLDARASRNARLLLPLDVGLAGCTRWSARGTMESAKRAVGSKPSTAGAFATKFDVALTS